MLKSIFGVFVLLCFLVLYEWWIKIFVSGDKLGFENDLFGLVYGSLALLGGINGILISLKYGGWRSVLGRGILFLSLGLLGAAFGQLTWSYYNFIAQVEIPYPSVADFGYFSIIVFYIFGMLSFAKASGASLSLKSLSGKVQAIIIPLIMLVIAYFFFLRNYEFDFSNPIVIFLDLGTPLGDAIYISLAILTYFLSKRLLGGLMKAKILFVLFAFGIQFAAEFMFLYMNHLGEYYNGSFVDMLFATSFVVMTLALNNFRYIATSNKS